MFDKVITQILRPVSNEINHSQNSHINNDMTKKFVASKNRNKYSQSVNEYLPNLLISNNVGVHQRDFALRTSIWDTESTQDMFDYENNKHIKVKDYKIESDYDIYLSGVDKNNHENQRSISTIKQKIRCSIVKAGVFNDNTFCGRLQNYRNAQYFIPGGDVECFKVIGKDIDKPTAFKAGTVIKIGRMKYFVKETYNGYENTSKIYQKYADMKNKKKTTKSLKSLSSGTCKFCLCDENDNPDILISPCGCKGSCAQVHVKCLQQWLFNKVSRKSTSVVEYLNYDNFFCELCKDELPTNMQIDGKIHNMLKQDSQKSEPYIVLEGLPNEKSSTKNNLTITIKFPQNRKHLIIGRGHETDIRLQDVSISRQHCYISLRNKVFELSDNKSKFGTLIKLPVGEKVQISNEKIQITRMIIQIVDKKMIKADQKKHRQNVLS